MRVLTTAPARLDVQAECMAVTRPLPLPGLLGESPYSPSFPQRIDAGAIGGSLSQPREEAGSE
eukprot:11189588-Lingulodinium_polyedra.AAC.1